MRASELNLVYDEHKLIVFPIRKAASTSIRKAFVETFGDTARYLSTPECADLGYFGVSIWRDPVERILSFHANKIQGKSSIHPQFAAVGMVPDQPLKDTIRIICLQPDETADPHFNSQHAMCRHNEDMLVNWVGAFKNIDESWQDLRCIVFGRTELWLPEHLERLNRSASEPLYDDLGCDLLWMIEERFIHDYGVLELILDT